MGRRKKDPPKERISADWNSYQPTEPLYWALGGPFLPVEDIPAGPDDPQSINLHMKRRDRRSSALYWLDYHTEEVAKSVARYRALKEKDMEALDPRVRASWRQKVHTGGALCQSRDSTIRGEADPVSQALALAYRDIGYHRGRILACRRVLDEIDQIQTPLFRREDP